MVIFFGKTLTKLPTNYSCLVIYFSVSYKVLVIAFFIVIITNLLLKKINQP